MRTTSIDVKHRTKDLQESWSYQPLHLTFPAHQPQSSPRTPGSEVTDASEPRMQRPHPPPSPNHVATTCSPAVAASSRRAGPHLPCPQQPAEAPGPILGRELLTLRPEDNAMLNRSSRPERRPKPPHTPNPQNLLHHHRGA